MFRKTFPQGPPGIVRCRPPQLLKKARKTGYFLSAENGLKYCDIKKREDCAPVVQFRIASVKYDTK